MTGPRPVEPFDINDLGESQRPGSYEAQLATWARSKVAQGADPDVVRARVGDLIHAYRSSLATKPETLDPETTGDKAAGSLSAAYQGLTMGAGNKITAGIRTVLPEALGGVKGFDYPEALKEQTGVLQDFQNRHPVASGALEVAGSIPTVLATGGGAGSPAGLLGRLGSMAKQGAAFGAAGGALSSNRLEDIGPNSIKGAFTGAAVGPLAGELGGLVARGAGAVARRIAPDAMAGFGRAVGTGPVTPEEKAQTLLQGALGRAGTTPDQVAAAIPSNMPTTIMDQQGITLPLVRQARNVPTSTARTTVDDFLNARAAGTGRRVESALSGATGKTATDVEQPVEDLIQQRAAQARPLYQEAYAHGDIQDPETIQQINALRKDPIFGKAWSRGQRLSKLELGDNAQAPPGIDPKQFAQLQAQGLDKFLPANLVTPPAPTVQQVDYWKRGLDAVIESGQGSKNALSRTEARVYRQKLNDVLDRVDQEVPAYAQARDSFRGNSELMEAAQAGADHFSPKTSADYLKRTLPDLSDGEQDAYRANALNAFVQRVRTMAANPDLPQAARGTNIVQRLMGTEDAGQKLRMLFPDDQGYQQFLNAMEQEASYPATNRFLTQQSSTAAQLAEGGVSSSMLRDAGAAAMGSPFGKIRLAQRIGQRFGIGGQGMPPAVADALARQAVQTGPALQQNLQSMTASKAALEAARRRTSNFFGNVTAANLGSP